MPYEQILFFSLLFLIAGVYASVGHGGASGYLALLAFYNFTPEFIRPTALLLNVFVSLIAFIQFYRKGYFRLKLFIPLAATSIPFAFIGGMIHIETSLYKILLGLFLLIAAARIAILSNSVHENHVNIPIPTALITGAIIGFISGILGIGGGILLSPVLLFLYRTNQKETAAVSALFIFVNSLAGLGGQMSTGSIFQTGMLWPVAVAFAGGWIGSYFGSNIFAQKTVRLVLSLVLIIASFKLLFFR